MTNLYEGYYQHVEHVAYLVEATMVSEDASSCLEGTDPFERVGSFLLAARFAGSNEALLLRQVAWLQEMHRDNELDSSWAGLSEDAFNARARQSAERSARSTRNWCSSQVLKGMLGIRAYCPEEVAGYTANLLHIMGVEVTSKGVSEVGPTEDKAEVLAAFADHMSKSWPLWAVTNPGFIAEGVDGVYPHLSHLEREGSIADFLHKIEI